MKANGSEVVMISHSRCVGHARQLLTTHGIAARQSKGRQELLLRVAADAADKARNLLKQNDQFKDSVVTAGSPWFQCYDCDEELFGGETYCPVCGAYVRS